VVPISIPGAIAPSVKWAQREGCPAAHAAHGGTIPRGTHESSGFATTRSPATNSVTASPAVSIVPTFSWPITNGNEENGEVAGLAWSATTARSLPQIPPSRVRIRTQSGPGSAGSSTSR
jgi:hypothetical protein